MTSKFSYSKLILKGIVSICFTLSLPTANAAIYKWTDEQGTIHYSDERPKNEQFKIKKITIKTSTNKQDNVDKNAQEPSKMKANDNTTDLKKALPLLKTDSDSDHSKQKLANINEAKRQHCERARTELTVLSKDIPVYLDDTEQYRLNWAGDTYTGKRDYLTDENRKAARTAAEEVIAEYCQDPNDEKALAIARKKWARSEYCLLNKAILKDLQRADIKASERQLNKQQELTEKYCNDKTIAFSMDEPELEIFPR